MIVRSIDIFVEALVLPSVMQHVTYVVLARELDLVALQHREKHAVAQSVNLGSRPAHFARLQGQ